LRQELEWKSSQLQSLLETERRNVWDAQQQAQMAQDTLEEVKARHRSELQEMAERLEASEADYYTLEQGMRENLEQVQQNHADEMLKIVNESASLQENVKATQARSHQVETECLALRQELAAGSQTRTELQAKTELVEKQSRLLDTKMKEAEAERIRFAQDQQTLSELKESVRVDGPFGTTRLSPFVYALLYFY
jgi:chromosome segregation ATPase